MSAILAFGTSLALPSVLIGFLIGFGGIGGVLLAPALNVIGSVPIHEAIRVCMWVYILSGLVGTAIFLRNNYIDRSMLVGLAIGACPGAFVGSFTLNLLEAHHLQILVAAVILSAGIYTFKGGQDRAGRKVVIGNGALIAVGALTGFGSSVTGTGGPLILIPILLLAGTDVKQAIGLAQPIQVPIGLVATVANLLSTELDYVLASTVAVAVAIGVFGGASLVHRSSDAHLKKFLGIALILIAVVYAAHGGGYLS